MKVLNNRSNSRSVSLNRILFNLKTISRFFVTDVSISLKTPQKVSIMT